MTYSHHLRETLELQPKIRFRKAMLTAVCDAEGGSQSLPERDFLLLCRRAGLPEPTRQALRKVEGRKRYLDVFWEEFGLAVEIDGRLHMEVSRWRDDLRRSNGLVLSGLMVLRFSATDVRMNPDHVAAQVKAALVGRGWTPTNKFG